MKGKRDTLIKVLSLGVGLAVGIVLVAKVFFELSYDGFYKDVERIYRIGSNYTMNGESEEYGQVSGGVSDGFMHEVPGVEYGTRVREVFNSDIFLDEDGNKVRGVLVAADSCFFKVFDRPVLVGDPVQVLAKWGSVMVSRSFAETVAEVRTASGGPDYSAVLGKQISCEDQPDLKLTVEGVFEDFPDNGTLDYDILLSMVSISKASTDNWMGNDCYRGYVKLYPSVDPLSLKDAIRKMQEAHQPLVEYEKNGISLAYTLHPFSKVHTSYPFIRMQIILLSIVAVLLVLISLLNYILVVISSLVKRSKEVGVRKCYGAGSKDIYLLLTKESLLNIFLALALAAAIISAGRNIVENLLGVPFTTLLVPGSMVAIALVVLVVLAVSIVVPAELYQRIPVYAALKNYTEHSRKWKLALLGVQVLINVFLVVMLFIISAQYEKVVRRDPGYAYETVFHVPTFERNYEVQERVVQTLRDLPEVTEVSGIEYSLPYLGPSGNNVYLPGNDQELFNFSDLGVCAGDYSGMLEFNYIEGRAPRNRSEIAVSRRFLEAMAEFADWSDGAVGKSVYVTGHGNTYVTSMGQMETAPFTISGVFENFLIGNLQGPDMRPAVCFFGEFGDTDTWFNYVVFKLNPSAGNVGAMKEKVRQALAEALPGRDLDIVSWKEEIRSAYDGSKKIRNTVLLGAIFSLLIALMGLVGFIRDESLRRSKEMAVRKINGATTRDILGIFALTILKLSAVMAVLAAVGSFFVARRWLQQFAEKITLSPSYFILGALVVLVIVLVVVVLNCLRIARANPVESLKNE
jgi:putative ABC transport system permease protein